MSLDEAVAACLIPLALWILVSGLDDLLIDAVFFLWPRRVPMPDDAELAAGPHRRIAIFVPLWQEHAVIGQMLDHNIAAIRYPNYDIFAGVYRNDAATMNAVQGVMNRHPHVHLSICPHDGPTSKADCLNWIYRSMQDFERESGSRFEVVVTHDAEDLVHPRELALIGHFSQRYDMVQIPVLPLPTPLTDWIHGLYCDEFAEYQTKDIPVRQTLGGFLPSNGVGCGFTRDALEAVAAMRGGTIFEPECLTEDYENGFCVHVSGRPQLFVPLVWDGAAPVATREYFPRRFRTAVRQRTRWVTGIALQGWQRHGWLASPGQIYWFWRDRKGLVGNLISPATNLIFLYGAVRWVLGSAGLAPGFTAIPNWLLRSCQITLAISFIQLCFRVWASARIYGATFALGVPVRALAGNCVNAVATARAVRQFAQARWRGARLAWGKTEHSYPQGDNLKAHVPVLGQVLLRLRHVNGRDLEAALLCQPQGVRLGEHLISLRMIQERQLYEGLSLQYGLPLADADAEPAAHGPSRVLPAAITRRWEVLPLGVRDGHLYVAVAAPPSEALTAALRRTCTLKIRYCLCPSSRLRLWRERWLGEADWPAATARANEQGWFLPSGQSLQS